MTGRRDSAEAALTEIPEHLLKRSRERRAAMGRGGDAPEGVDDGEKSDDQLSIEQGRLRGVKGGGESGKSSMSAKAPAKTSGTQRRRKAS